jgi:uncharacterized protein (TIGR01777 family)
MGRIEKALVTGATGFVGRHLLSRLAKPVVLSRSLAHAQAKLGGFAPTVFQWNPVEQPAPAAAFKQVDTVFHLAGEPVAEGRWSAAKKRRLVDSRVLGTRHLVDTLLKLERKPRVLVSASAVGYYGNRGDEILDESDRPGQGFLPSLCVAWEREAMRAAEAGIRVVQVRIGIVLGKDGGALARMLPLFQKGLGSVLGTGKQYMPWIHINDLVELFLFAAQCESLAGPVNGTGPIPVTNREFTRALAPFMRVPNLLPAVPPFVLKLALGEFGNVLLHSQQALPRAAMRAGYRFEYGGLNSALKDLLRNNATAAPTEPPRGAQTFLGAETNQ